jgi:hypothetical protein
MTFASPALSKLGQLDVGHLTILGDMHAPLCR